MSFLLDTDTCSAYLKGAPVVFNCFIQYGGGLHVSVLTVGELLTWALRAKAPPQRRQDIQALLTAVAVLDLTRVAPDGGSARIHVVDVPQPSLIYAERNPDCFNRLRLELEHVKRAGVVEAAGAAPAHVFHNGAGLPVLQQLHFSSPP